LLIRANTRKTCVWYGLLYYCAYYGVPVLRNLKELLGKDHYSCLVPNVILFAFWFSALFAAKNRNSHVCNYTLLLLFSRRLA
jgi:hypothetical protein